MYTNYTEETNRVTSYGFHESKTLDPPELCINANDSLECRFVRSAHDLVTLVMLIINRGKLFIIFFKGKAFFLLNPVEGAFFNKL